MYELRKYHGDKVMSLTYEGENQEFSVGIIACGEYQFGALKQEIFTVTHGMISVWIEGQEEEWIDFNLGDSFIVRDHKNFKLKVETISAYICFYED